MAVCLLAGCAGTPYVEVALAYQIEDYSDYWVQRARDFQADDPPQFHLEIGLEFDHGYACGIHHRSHLLAGGPFNSDPEIYANDIRCSKKWGGK